MYIVVKILFFFCTYLLSDYTTVQLAAVAFISYSIDHRPMLNNIHRVSKKNCANLFFAPCLSNMNRFQ